MIWMGPICRMAVAIGAFLLLGAALNAQTTYRDPDGLYTVQAPAGWTITKDAGSGQVAIKNGAVSATLAITQTKDWPKDVQEVQDMDEKEMQGQCPTYRLLQRGKTTLAGAPGAFFLTSCADPKSPAIAEISAAITRDRILILFDAISPKARYYEALPELEAIRSSIRLKGQNAGDASTAGEGGGSLRMRQLKKACVAEVFARTECVVREFALNGEEARQEYRSSNPPRIEQGIAYRDPRGRFTVTVPQSWKANPQGDNGENGVQFTHGATRTYVGMYQSVTRPGDAVLQLEKRPQSGPAASPDDNAPMGRLGLIQILGNGLDVTYDEFDAKNPQGEPIGMFIAGVAGLASPEVCCVAVIAFVAQDDRATLEGLLLSIARSIQFPKK